VNTNNFQEKCNLKSVFVGFPPKIASYGWGWYDCLSKRKIPWVIDRSTVMLPLILSILNF